MATLSASVSQDARPQSALAQAARPQSSLAGVARPQAGGFSSNYDFAVLIVTFAGIQIQDFDGNNLQLFTA